MNTICTNCIICNKKFQSLVYPSESHNFIPLLTRIWELFCRILDLKSRWQDILEFYTDSHEPFCPFCDECQSVVALLVVYQDKLDSIVRKIENVRCSILTTIIETCNCDLTDSTTVSNESDKNCDSLDTKNASSSIDNTGIPEVRSNGTETSNSDFNHEQVKVAKRVKNFRKTIFTRFNPQIRIVDCHKKVENEKIDQNNAEDLRISIKVEPVDVDTEPELNVDQNTQLAAPANEFQFEKIKVEPEASTRVQIVDGELTERDNRNDDDEDFDCTAVMEIEMTESEDELEDDQFFDDPLYVPSSDSHPQPSRKKRKTRTKSKEKCQNENESSTTKPTPIVSAEAKVFKCAPHFPNQPPNDDSLFCLGATHSLAQAVAFNKTYPKPDLPFSCLAAMALRNSKSGSLPYSQMCNFISTHFPYYRCAPSGEYRPWTQSLFSNLSSNPSFIKTLGPSGNTLEGKSQVPGQQEYHWSLQPSKAAMINEDLERMFVDHRDSILFSMADPQNLPLMEAGEFYEEIEEQQDDDDEDKLMIVENSNAS